MTGCVGVFERPDIYELAIREEMMKFSATQMDFGLLSQELIWNNFVKHREPKDVAWAIMQ